MVQLQKYIWCLSALLFWSVTLPAQTPVDFELVEVQVHDTINTVNLRIRALDGKRSIPIDGSKIEITEAIDGTDQAEAPGIIQIVNEVVELELDSLVTEPATISILLDLHLNSQELDQAKAHIRKIFDEQASATIYLTTFGDEIRSRQVLSTNNFESILSGLTGGEPGSDLYRALAQEVRFIKRFPGKQLLFLFSNGENLIENNPVYELQLPLERTDLYAQLEQLESDFYLFPVYYSPTPDSVLLNFVDASPTRQDDLTAGNLPDNLSEIIASNIRIESNYIVKVNPVDPVFRGRERLYTIRLISGDYTSAKSVVYGSREDPVNIARPPTFGKWLQWFLIGLAILALSWLGSRSLVPWFRRRAFVKNYVREYVPTPNRRTIDPLTNEPIMAGELVVTKCRQVTPLATWEGLGWQCPNYPDCMDFQDPCNGEGAPEISNQFFSMQGPYRKLNWMWFGLSGGFMAWILFAFFKFMNFSWYRNLLGRIYNTENLEQTVVGGGQGGLILQQRLESLANDTLVGIAFGTGLILMLAWVEERNQPREISIGRIILRTILGTVAALLIFLFGFNLELKGILPAGYWSGLAVWVAFGIVAGLILSIKSSIITMRGVLGGFLASLVAYHAYLGIAALFQDYIGAKLIGLLVLGGILGTILVSVISALENFELEYISPERFQGIVPISKWLKSGMDIHIGTDSSCYVYVKWSDPEVQPQHAKLVYQNGAVFIVPMAETMVRGRIIPHNKRTPLHNGDIIQLGRHSVTRMRYREKRYEQGPGQPKRRPDPGSDGKARIVIKR